MVIHAVAAHTLGFRLLVPVSLSSFVHIPCQIAVYRLMTLKFIVIVLSYLCLLQLEEDMPKRGGEDTLVHWLSIDGDAVPYSLHVGRAVRQVRPIFKGRHGNK